MHIKAAGCDNDPERPWANPFGNQDHKRKNLTLALLNLFGARVDGE